MTREKTVSKEGLRTKELVAAAVMCAVTAVLSQIAVPLPSGVPVTLQTFAVALCAYILETRYAAASMAVYLLLGLVGVPVFANFGAGPGKLAGLTGGFLWGFLLFCVIASFSMRQKRVPVRIAAGILGLLVCHLCGVIQFSALSGTGFGASLLLVSLPYLPKDILSVVLAYLVAGRIRPLIRR